MLKVKNKNVAKEIAKITYKSNMKRNTLTIFAIIMTTMLIAVVIAVGFSYWNTISQRQIRMEGMDYDIEFSEPREDQAEKIRSMNQVKYAGLAVKCAVVQEYKNNILGKTRLYYLDETCFEKQTIPAFDEYEGSYPQNENEILFSVNALRSMGIQNPVIGMKLLLTYNTLSEKTDNTEPAFFEKEFTLCGWYKDYAGIDRGYISKEFLESTGVKQTDFTQGSLRIKLKNPLALEKVLTDIREEINMDISQIAVGDVDSVSAFYNMIAGLIALLLLIFVSGYLFIYNTLYISIAKDIRYFGQLKTIGMTSVQLKGMIYRQAIWNSCIGIPIGLLISIIISKFAVPNLINLANPGFAADEIVTANIWAFLISGLFALLTNLFSCRIPAKIVGGCSPISALNYIGRIKHRRNTKRVNSSLYAMAGQNMFRNKKQTFVIILSFIIAVSVFFIVNVVIRSNNAELLLNEIYPYDIRFLNNTTLEDEEKQIFTESKLKEIENIPGVKSVRAVSSARAVVPYQEEVFGEYFKALYETRYSPGNYEEDMELYKQNPEHSYFTSRFIGVDESAFEELNESLFNVLDKEAFMSGEVAVAENYFMEDDSNMTGKTVEFYLPDDANPTKMYSIQIAAVGGRTNHQAYFAGGYTPSIIVSNQFAEKLLGEPHIELINVIYEEAFSMETEQSVKAVFADEKDISNDSKLERYADMKNSETQIKVLGNCIGMIIALLAILNYLNTMAANIQNRTKEFAVLESIGMTEKQIRKMLNIEGIGYALISIIFSLALGIPCSYAVFSKMNMYQISYSIPWTANFVLFFAVLIVCVISPVLIYRLTQNKSIIEQLRSLEG